MNQQFFIHDSALYKDFKVVIVRVVPKGNKWYYEVRPEIGDNPLPQLIFQNDLKRLEK